MGVFLTFAVKTKTCILHSGCGPVHEEVEQPHNRAFVHIVSDAGFLKLLEETDDGERVEGVKCVQFYLRGFAL